MVRRAVGCAQLFVPALALFISQAAAAAPEGGTQEAQPAQAQPDDHSYLPPWMQKREMAGIGDGTAGPADPNNPNSAQKTPALSQGQKPQRHHRNDFFPSLKFWSF
jgi:hypothetical protein